MIKHQRALAPTGFLAAFFPAASFAEVAGGAAGVGDGATGTTSTCVGAGSLASARGQECRLELRWPHRDS